ncbi:MAG: hypothetical protein M3Y87_04660 [Myxococcota bacterium]|nr:hypothetical protein [Myxococcota bacterium]
MRSTFRSASLALACFAFLAACGGNEGTPDSGTTGMDGGPRDASAPPCSTTGPENTVAACTDTCDNDVDDYADCDDFDCCALRTDCPADSECGSSPGDGGTVVACETAGPEETLEACSDGCDNEPDRFADCNDFDCCDVRSDCPATTACGAATMRDGGMTACDGGGALENTTELCANGTDDDCDGFTDCNDFGCCSRLTCGVDTACGMRDAGPPRDAGPIMACDGAMIAEDTLAACMDGCSNDGDRFVDCDDFDCCGPRVDCPATTACGSRPDSGPIMDCPGPDAPEDTLAACSDGCSNDGDRFVDCEDRDCCTVRTDCPAASFCGRM